MKHRTNKQFWQTYDRLPAPIRALADKNFKLLQSNPYHPSLHFKRVGRLYSVRVGIDYRAVALIRDAAAVWFWIGSHADYNDILKSG